MTAAYVYFTVSLTTTQFEATSRHIAVVANIPIHNTSIYITKLYSIRCHLNLAGSVLEYVVYSCIKGHRNPNKNRGYSSIVYLCLLVVVRVFFVLTLHFSRQLGYHLYIVFAMEGLFLGSSMSIISIAPEHAVAMMLAFSSCRILVTMFQFIIDCFLFRKPLVMMQIQAWLAAILSILGLALWIYYIHGESCMSESEAIQPEITYSDSPKQEMLGVASFTETLKKGLSPLLIFPAGSIYKDFLYPGVLPYALLQRDKCHIINKLSTIMYGIGSMTLFIFERLGLFDKWSHRYDTFWVATIPINVISAYTMMAIHTKMPAATRIRNSKLVIMTMTLILMIYYGFALPLSFDGVAKVVDKGFVDEKMKGDNTLITLNTNLAFIYCFVFSKISVGYNKTRVNLGYHLPKFRPNHRMSRSNLAWYFMRSTFKNAWRDITSDIKLNIKDYL